MSRRGHREGSIYRRTDGRWTAQITLGDGRRKYIYGKTRKNVAKRLTEALKAVQDDVPLPSGRITVASFASDWLRAIRPSIRPKTYEGYESAMRTHLVPAFGHLRLSKLGPLHLERLYGDLSAKGLSPTTVSTYHSRIHTMLSKAMRLGLVSRNVSELVDLPRKPAKEPPMFTPEQTRDFLAAAKGHRLEALFALAITTGARQGELFGLTWDRVDFDAGEIEIRRTLQKVDGSFELAEPKTPRSKRRIALTGVAVEALRRHRVR